jgi:hypothetical protein
MEMAVFGLTKPITDAPPEYIAMCNDVVDAVNLCMNLSTVRYTRGAWALYLGMAEGSLSLILNKGGSSKRKRFINPDLFGQIQERAGNRAISQYFDMESRGLLNRQSKKTRIQELEAELARLKA